MRSHGYGGGGWGGKCRAPLLLLSLYSYLRHNLKLLFPPQAPVLPYLGQICLPPTRQPCLHVPHLHVPHPSPLLGLEATPALGLDTAPEEIWKGAKEGEILVGWECVVLGERLRAWGFGGRPCADGDWSSRSFHDVHRIFATAWECIDTWPGEKGKDREHQGEGQSMSWCKFLLPPHSSPPPTLSLPSSSHDRLSGPFFSVCYPLLAILAPSQLLDLSPASTNMGAHSIPSGLHREH